VSIHLVGGGRDGRDDAAAFRAFVADSAARAAALDRVVPRIGVLLVESEEPGVRGDEYAEFLRRAGSCDPVVTVVPEGGAFESRVLGDIDGLLIGGGHTPSYVDAVSTITDEIRLLVSDGLPYLGFSAGAAIAADRAIVGGWLVGGVPVCPEDAAEDLDEVTIVQGLGLVDLAIDVHAAQWGTLARLVAATEAGLVDGGVAIDEYTALVVGDGRLEVVGIGSVWRVTPHDDGVLVGTLGA
jgi:cyanophycinase